MNKVSFSKAFLLPHHDKEWLEGTCQLVEERITEGWTSFIVTLKFDHLGGSEADMLQKMKDEINRVYGALVKRTTYNSRTPSGSRWRPICFFFPDYPVPKRDRDGRLCLEKAKVNNGLHLQGIVLIPPRCKLRCDLKQHFFESRFVYIKKGVFPLRELDAKPISETPEKATDYIFKMLERRRFSVDDVIIFPLSLSELPPRESPELRCERRKFEAMFSMNGYVPDLQKRVRAIYKAVRSDALWLYGDERDVECCNLVDELDCQLEYFSELIDYLDRFTKYEALILVRDTLKECLRLMDGAAPSFSEKLVALINDIDRAEDKSFKNEKDSWKNERKAAALRHRVQMFGLGIQRRKEAADHSKQAMTTKV